MKKSRILSLMLAVVMLVMTITSAVSASTVYIDMNFKSMEDFTSKFVAGQFYVEGSGLLYGYAEAKALQTLYSNPEGWFDNSYGYTWLEYDATITLAVGDDDLSEAPRWINLVYCNDNLMYYGHTNSRVYMSFSYDIQNRCFRLTDGYNNDAVDAQYLPPVYKEINTDADEFFTMGISITKNRMRCFYNDELIFDYKTSDKFIARDINSPFLFWQDGNYVQISNITIAEPCSIFPLNNTVYGDANKDGNVNLSDVTIMLKHIAKWENLDIDTVAADVTVDGNVNLSDVTMVLKYIAKWVEVKFG